VAVSVVQEAFGFVVKGFFEGEVWAPAGQSGTAGAVSSSGQVMRARQHCFFSCCQHGRVFVCAGCVCERALKSWVVEGECCL
jgi:hypothetical protein